jgi:hypothetical protein
MAGTRTGKGDTDARPRPSWSIQARPGLGYRYHRGRPLFQASRTPRRLAAEYPGSPVRTAAGVAPSARALFKSGKTVRSSGTRSARNGAPAQKCPPLSPFLSRTGYRYVMA